MSSILEKFIQGENKTSYTYFGAHKISEGFCFRVYAPHAKAVEVVVNGVNYKMEREDFRGVYEARVKEVKEFDSYHYEILTEDDVWVNKNDPYTFYFENDKSLIVESDEYEFNDEKWMNKELDKSYFNACLVRDNFKMDEQREFIDYLREYNYNYLIIKPYDLKYLYCVNKQFINESSLKKFIDNLHQVNIGVIFDFETEYFFDYPEGLDNFDGKAIYNKENDKYKDVSKVYFDYSRNHTKSYITSFINYYLENFHGDGIVIDSSDISEEIVKDLTREIVIYKDNKGNGLNSDYLNKFIEIINNEFDYKKFLSLETNDEDYLFFDYESLFNKVKGNEEYKKEILKILLVLTYVSNNYKVSVYNENEEYLKELKILSDLYKNSKALFNKQTRNLLLNGKKNNYFAYDFSYRNDHVIIFFNFSNLVDEKFDLGMPYYGYYNLVYDSKINGGDETLYLTRSKKMKDKELAMRMNVKENQVLVYKRMKDI